MPSISSSSSHFVSRKMANFPQTKFQSRLTNQPTSQQSFPFRLPRMSRKNMICTRWPNCDDHPMSKFSVAHLLCPVARRELFPSLQYTREHVPPRPKMGTGCWFDSLSNPTSQHRHHHHTLIATSANFVDKLNFMQRRRAMVGQTNWKSGTA